ncbi:MAG: FAD-binding protein [Bryobacteraceae bacterium]
MLKPQTPAELAGALANAAAAGAPITLGGSFSKNAMGGPVLPAGTVISTASLDRILQYEPRDLTISVEAGITFAELSRALAANRQMIPLDPPFSDRATIGGILAANTSGPRRRLYGTARDLVIGMKFATLEGKLVQSGGMVVKNVAGLDTAKLLIGSFGTLAAIAVANFKLVPMPPASRTFALSFASLDEAIAARNAILATVLQPAAIDLLDPAAAARLGFEGFLLAVRAGGNLAVIERYGRELAGARAVEGAEEEALWRRIQDFTPHFLAECPEGAVVRVSCLLSELGSVMASLDVPVVARAGSGVVYGYFADWESAGRWIKQARRAVIEFAPESAKRQLELWPNPGDDLAIMTRVKQMFDPGRLLNRGRLYGRI